VGRHFSEISVTALTLLIVGALPGAIRSLFKLIVSPVLIFLVLGWLPAMAGDPIDPVAALLQSYDTAATIRRDCRQDPAD
jgi:hypothetical protein